MKLQLLALGFLALHSARAVNLNHRNALRARAELVEHERQGSEESWSWSTRYPTPFPTNGGGGGGSTTTTRHPTRFPSAFRRVHKTERRVSSVLWVRERRLL